MRSKLTPVTGSEPYYIQVFHHQHALNFKVIYINLHVL